MDKAYEEIARDAIHNLARAAAALNEANALLELVQAERNALHSWLLHGLHCVELNDLNACQLWASAATGALARVLDQHMADVQLLGAPTKGTQ